MAEHQPFFHSETLEEILHNNTKDIEAVIDLSHLTPAIFFTDPLTTIGTAPGPRPLQGRSRRKCSQVVSPVSMSMEKGSEGSTLYPEGI